VKTRIGCTPVLARLALGLHIDNRHQRAPILHDVLAVAVLDGVDLDLLEPGDERQRHGLHRVGAGPEPEQRRLVLLDPRCRRCDGIGRLGLPVDRADGRAKRIRVDDHDDAAVAENSVAGEDADVA
jgi:hypothetical protein